MGTLICDRAEAMILRSCLGGSFSPQGEIRDNCAQFFFRDDPGGITIDDHTGKFHQFQCFSARIAAPLTITPHMQTCRATSELLEAQSSRLQMSLPDPAVTCLLLVRCRSWVRRLVGAFIVSISLGVANGSSPGMIFEKPIVFSLQLAIYLTALDSMSHLIWPPWTCILAYATVQQKITV